MRYTVRIRHKTDKSDKWSSTGFPMFPETPEGLKAAEEEAKMLNDHPGNPSGLWKYRVFEYHGKRDYRSLSTPPEEVNP